MNTHDIDIELPPLPFGNPTYEFPDGAYDSEQMHQYALAAIEADRQQLAAEYRKELDKLSQRNYELRFDNLNMQTDRKRRGEPVSVGLRNLLERCREFIDTTTCPAYPAGTDIADDIDAFLAPQPAEPVSVAERLDALADAAPAGSLMQSDLYAAATAWRKHMAGPTAQPQPSDNSGDLPEALIPAEPDLDYLRSMVAGDNLPAMLRGNILAAVRRIEAAQPSALPPLTTIRFLDGGIVQMDASDYSRLEAAAAQPSGQAQDTVRLPPKRTIFNASGGGEYHISDAHEEGYTKGWNAAIDAARQRKEQP